MKEIVKETKWHNCESQDWKETLEVLEDEEGYLLRRFDNDKKIQEIKIDNEFIKDLAFNIHNNGSLVLDFDFVDGIDWGGLAEYYEVELEDGIGFDHPKGGIPNPRFRDYNFYGQVIDQNKYIMINKIGQHKLVDADNQREVGHGVTFP